MKLPPFGTRKHFTTPLFVIAFVKTLNPDVFAISVTSVIGSSNRRSGLSVPYVFMESLYVSLWNGVVIGCPASFQSAVMIPSTSV